MDPNACLLRAEDALLTRDLTEAINALADYRAWRDKGGFDAPNGEQRFRGIQRDLNQALRSKARKSPTGASR